MGPGRPLAARRHSLAAQLGPPFLAQAKALALGRGPPPCGPARLTTDHRSLSGSTYSIFSRIDHTICAAL